MIRWNMSNEPISCREPMTNNPTGIKDWIYKRISLGYIVGTEVDDAVKACQKIAPMGWSSTICPWNYNGDKAETVAESYKIAAREIIGNKLNCYLSIKAPAFEFREDLLQEIIEIARPANLRIHFDAQNPESADNNLALFARTLKNYAHISYTLPARWQRSAEDAKRINEWGVAVRIVKGEWADPQQPHKNPQDGFFHIAEVLAGKASHVAVATHNVKLAQTVIGLLQSSGTSCELEQLYGLPTKTVSVAQQAKIPVRFYIPYGRACLPYGLAMMRKKPVMAWWVMRDLFVADRFRISTK